MSTNQSDQALLEKPTKNTRSKRTKVQKPKETNTSKASTRKELKQEKKLGRRPRRRIFPIWLRIVVVSVLATVALISGLMIGYGVLGGGNALDALRVETWQHIIDIVMKVE